MRRYIFLLFVFILLLTYISLVAKPDNKSLLSKTDLAEVGITESEKITSNMLIYPLKRISEELTIYIKVEPKEKEAYQFELLDSRYKELVFIINNQKTGYLVETVNRYNGHVGNIKQSYPVTKSEFKEGLRLKVETLEFLRDKYHANSSYWLSIQQAIDTTKALH